MRNSIKGEKVRQGQDQRNKGRRIGNEGKKEGKINKWDYIQLKCFFTAKETIDKTKRQTTEWEKIFANDMTHKRLISKIYKQLI